MCPVFHVLKELLVVCLLINKNNFLFGIIKIYFTMNVTVNNFIVDITQSINILFKFFNTKYTIVNNLNLSKMCLYSYYHDTPVISTYLLLLKY